MKADHVQEATDIDGRPSRPDRLSIQDPNKADNNISGGSARVRDIFASFSEAHRLLKDRVASAENGRLPRESLLEPLLGGNYGSYGKSRRAAVDSWYDQSHHDLKNWSQC